MPESTFEQPAQRLRGPGGRGRAGLATWVLLGVAVVGAGIGGRLASEPGPSDPLSAAATPTTGPAEIAGQGQALVLTEPGDAEVTTVAVHVRGQAAEAVSQVEIVLMRDERALSSQIVQPRRGRFVGVFTLGRPRVAGSITVMAVGRDRHGTAVATVRREFAVAALLAAAVEPRPMLGEDGIFGSRGVDLTAFLERAPGRSVARPDRHAWPVGDLGWHVNPAQL